jgi:hypothetical protein
MTLFQIRNVKAQISSGDQPALRHTKELLTVRTERGNKTLPCSEACALAKQLSTDFYESPTFPLAPPADISKKQIRKSVELNLQYLQELLTQVPPDRGKAQLTAVFAAVGGARQEYDRRHHSQRIAEVLPSHLQLPVLGYSLTGLDTASNRGEHRASFKPFVELSLQVLKPEKPRLVSCEG